MYDSWTVVQAFCLTTVVVLSLTAYTLQSKRDFSSMGAILFSALLLMIFGGLLQVNKFIIIINLFEIITIFKYFKVIFHNQVLHTVLAVFGAFLFSAFIVYDTHLIMKHLNPEEYIVGVINLYLDIINLFLGKNLILTLFFSCLILNVLFISRNT